LRHTIAAARSGDEEAFRHLYRAVQPRLLLSLREFSGDEDDETEVAQAAARLWPRIVGSLGEFRVDLLAVTAAAEQENDLAGEEAAVAAFRRSSGASVHSLPRITSSGTPVASSALANRRRATRALAAALTAVAVAGAGGVAAATDALPVPVSGSQSHRVSTRPSSEADLLNTAGTRRGPQSISPATLKPAPASPDPLCASGSGKKPPRAGKPMDGLDSPQLATGDPGPTAANCGT